MIFAPFATLLLLVLSSIPTQAATRKVRSLANSGLGTLREAIGLSLNGDLIEIDAEGIILLDSGLVTARTISIVGPGANRLFVSPSNPKSLFGSSLLRVDAGTLNTVILAIKSKKNSTAMGAQRTWTN